jgi:hypothetical protein
MKQLSITFLFLLISLFAFAQGVENFDVQRVRLFHPTLGNNTDPTWIYRAGETTNASKLRIGVGDETLGSFEIGYTHHNDSLGILLFQ